MQAKITNPCSKNWSDMVSTEGGRYCSFCDRVVVDFTSMSDTEIKKYFLEKSDQKTCGHFKSSQVLIPGNSFLKRLHALKTELIQRSSAGIFTKLSLYVVSLLLIVTGCIGVTGKAAAPELTGDSIGIAPQPIEDIDTTAMNAEDRLGSTHSF